RPARQVVGASVRVVVLDELLGLLVRKDLLEIGPDDELLGHGFSTTVSANGRCATRIVTTVSPNSGSSAYDQRGDVSFCCPCGAIRPTSSACSPRGVSCARGPSASFDDAPSQW